MNGLLAMYCLKNGSSYLRVNKLPYIISSHNQITSHCLYATRKKANDMAKFYKLKTGSEAEVVELAVLIQE